MVTINNQIKTPIYEQIVNEIKNNILTGKLKAQEQIPSIRELAHTLGINPNTVTKAYRILEREKMIETYSTNGTFITNKLEKIMESEKEKSLEKMKQTLEIIKKLGVSKEAILERVDNIWQVS